VESRKNEFQFILFILKKRNEQDSGHSRQVKFRRADIKPKYRRRSDPIRSDILRYQEINGYIVINEN
jgi:hypothetical protein